MKARYQQFTKLIPVFEGVTFLELEDIFRTEFGLIRFEVRERE